MHHYPKEKGAESTQKQDLSLKNYLIVPKRRITFNQMREGNGGPRNSQQGLLSKQRSASPN